MEYCSALKKVDIVSFGTEWKELQVIMLSDVHKKKERQLTIGWFHSHVAYMKLTHVNVSLHFSNFVRIMGFVVCARRRDKTMVVGAVWNYISAVTWFCKTSLCHQ